MTRHAPTLVLASIAFFLLVGSSAEAAGEPCGAGAGNNCGADEFCKLPVGDCGNTGGAGVCTVRPQACVQNYDPVCGCDGLTYGNECEADQAGVPIASHGACEQACGGLSGISCDAGEFCRLPPGFCDVQDVSGDCVPVPAACPEIYDPVCGCDGVTYDNPCFADAAGAQIDHAGSCEPRVCGGIAGVPCDSDEFCKLPPGQCNVSDLQGICQPVPQDCPAIYDPVCGCDGMTYGNECEADAAGAQVDHPGECDRVCGGIAGFPCEADEYCQFADGTCDIVDNQGVCRPIPQGCPDVWDPVCGCDGVTYGNRCEAAAVGAQVDYEGECGPRVCGGIAGIPCDEGEFCKLPDGECDTVDLAGICRPIPEACPEIYDPVCGCDGRTYSNACFADQAGVQVDHEGECGPQVCGGIAGIPCDDGEYCMFPDGTCNIADNQGVCQPVPQACPDVWDPVCGCDGQTYGNRCEAAAAGVSIDSEGECAQVCGGIAGIPCDEGEFCKLPDGECDTVDLSGICRPIPDACPEIYDPVCGCDGRTYSNACFADQAGVQVDHEGECGPQVCGGIAGIPCDDGEYCMFPDGTCNIADNQGVCQPVPQACPDVWDPVCGCDGQTYGNRCEAAAAGVSIDSEGECARVCGGIAGIPCDDGEYCQFADGTCNIADNQGVCRPIPQGCPDVWDPVCGCDGRTYGNRCEAAAAGVSIDTEGECAQVCGGIAGIPCDEGEFCKLPAGQCEVSDLQGICMPLPYTCPLFYDPVCGCDGVTYDNECDADLAGAQVAYDGACAPVCGGIAGIPCDDGEYCMFPVGTCEFADNQGVCRPVPQACPDVWDPVCGCDGQTYGNRCEAAAAEAQIAAEGECEKLCGGFIGIPCDEGEYCQYPVGTCNFADHYGVCVTIPDTCPEVCHPVCGCDGITYGNLCLAEQALISLAHRGECDPTGRLIGRVRFVTSKRMLWQPAPGASSYNVYVEVHETPPPANAGECYLSRINAGGIVPPGVTIGPDPDEGQVWLIQVTGVFSDGEGPMGMSSDCTFRAPEVPCDPQ